MEVRCVNVWASGLSGPSGGRNVTFGKSSELSSSRRLADPRRNRRVREILQDLLKLNLGPNRLPSACQGGICRGHRLAWVFETGPRSAMCDACAMCCAPWGLAALSAAHNRQKDRQAYCSRVVPGAYCTERSQLMPLCDAAGTANAREGRHPSLSTAWLSPDLCRCGLRLGVLVVPGNAHVGWVDEHMQRTLNAPKASR